MCIVQCARTLLSNIAQTGQFVIFEYGFESDRPPPFPNLGNQNDRYMSGQLNQLTGVKI
jgi:hypothetical protein